MSKVTNLIPKKKEVISKIRSLKKARVLTLNELVIRCLKLSLVMIIITWNNKGIGMFDKHSLVHNFLKLHDWSIICF